MAIQTKNAKEIFVEAIEQYAPSQWPEFLNEACGNDTSLQKRVEILLKAHIGDESLLDRPAIAPAQTLEQSTERTGTLIGPYKLLEQIGEGGMGLVYMAEQQRPMRRLVALKLIKPGMDSRQVIARFEAEKQALAMMDHENIAKVFEAGTTDTGRFYFAMELVRGIPINEFCDQKRLSVGERLELFIQVCRAVQHAHQKGIIHRDLKPSNVLVTMNDATPLPKVIDFGIAKALGQQLTEHTLHTGFAQIVGTPLYMSPEQAEMNHLGVDTRSDVYSLGVLLYELLTGQTPFDKETLAKAGLDEMRRMIREDEPPRPSNRVSTLNAQASSTISQRRSLDDRHLSRVLRGELDWIVMKSLEKDRSRRYESASALAADIQRYLSDEPVLACPPTTMYRFQKFARKHKPALATAAAIALCLILGTTVSAWQAVRATTAEAQANANEQKATTQRDEAQKQRDEVKALNDKLAAKEQQLQRSLYASNMNLAKSAWDAGKIRRVNELLDQHRPQPGETDLRGFEWHYLHRLCHSEILTIKPLVEVNAIAYSPDGTRLVTVLRDNTLNVWDAQTGKILVTLNRDKSSDGGECVAYSPDGKRLAYANSVWDDSKNRDVNHEVKVCDAETGQELLTLKGHTIRISSVVFSRDGKRLATGSEGEPREGKPAELKVWDAQTGQELLNCPGHADIINSLAFSPDGKRLASADGDAKVWDARTGEELFTIEDAESVAFSPDGMRLASGGKVWDVQTGKEILALKRDGRNLAYSPNLAFSPDGKRLASTGSYVTVWDAETGDELLTFKGHTSGVNGVVFSPDGKRLASHSGDRTIKVWDATTSQEARTLGGDTNKFGKVAFSPDGKCLAGAAETEVKVLDAQSGQELVFFKGHAKGINSVAYSPDGKRLASASSDKTVKVWDAQTGREMLTFQGHTAAVICVAFSPDGTRVVSCSSLPNAFWFGGGGIGKDPGEPGEVVVWDATSGQELLNLKGHSKFVNAVAYSPDGTRLATLSRDQTAKIWDAQTGRELHTMNVLAGIRGRLAFSPDGKRLASSSSGPPGENTASGAKVWDAQTGEELLNLPAGYVGSLAFTPDGKRVVTGTTVGRGELQVWDAQTGQELLTLDGYSGYMHDEFVAFSPDGHRLVGRGHDRTVKIWDATPLPEKP